MRAQLVDALVSAGACTSPAVAAAFRAVPRERFVPEVAAREGLAAVYRDQALVTRRDARGVPTSSSSQPSLMAAMLEALALEPGQRVLELGTGTGYHAALLSTLWTGPDRSRPSSSTPTWPSGPESPWPPGSTGSRWWWATAASGGRQGPPSTASW